MRQNKKDSAFANAAFLTGILLLLAVMLIFSRTIAGRVRYVFTGSTQSWEETALEEGYLSEVEEYYYDHLPEERQEAYREIYVHLMRNEDAGDFRTQISAEDFWDVYYAVLADHPEIFWTDTSAQVEETSLTNSVVYYQFDVTVPAEEREEMLERLEAAADDCIREIPSDATDYEKIKFVYEYLINTTEYNASALDSQNIQSALLYHESVCAGYSRAFQFILHRMGMFCTYVTGTVIGSGDHGWNLVRIGEEYYYVDVTWGDPVFAESMQEYGTDDRINYTYLCCTEEDLFKTHVPSELIALPDCTSDAYDYYKLNGEYYDTFDANEISEALMASVRAGETRIEMKFGSEEAYQAAQTALFDEDLISRAGQYLMRVHNVTSWNYRYHLDDNFRLITIYWM